MKERPQIGKGTDNLSILKDKNRTSLTTADIQADAQRKLEVIRAFIAEFSDGDSLAELTTDQLRIASRTTPAYLRKGAIVADAAPLTGYPENASSIMRFAADVDEALTPLVTALADAERVARITIARVKLEAADAARIVRRVATTYSRTPQGAGLRETVEEMRAAQARPARREKKTPEQPADKK